MVAGPERSPLLASYPPSSRIPVRTQTMGEDFGSSSSLNASLSAEMDYPGSDSMDSNVSGSIDDHLHTFAVNVPSRGHILLSQTPTHLVQDDGSIDSEFSDPARNQMFPPQLAPSQSYQGNLSTRPDSNLMVRVICQRDGCGKDFKSKKYLERHIKTCHGPAKMYACEYCSQTFSRTDSRKRHQDECLKRQAKKGLVTQTRKRAADDLPSTAPQRPKAFAKRTNQLTVDTSVAAPIFDTLSDVSTPLLSNGSGMTPNSAAPDSSQSIAALAALARPPVISPRSSSLPYRHSDKRGSRASILPAEYQSPYLQVNGRSSPRFSHRHSSSAEASYTAHKSFPPSRSLNQLYAEELALSVADNFSTTADSPGLGSIDNPDLSHPPTPQFFGQDGSELLALRSRLPYLEHSRPSSGEYSSVFGGHQSMSSLDLTLTGGEGASPTAYQPGFNSHRASSQSLEQMEQPLFGYAIRDSPVQGTSALHYKTEPMPGPSRSISSQRVSQVGSQDNGSSFRHSNNDMCLTEPTNASFGINSPQVGSTSFSLSDNSNYASLSVPFNPPSLDFDQNFTGQNFSDSFPSNFFSNGDNNNNNNGNGLYTLDNTPLFGDYVDMNNNNYAFENPRSPRAPVSAS